MFEGAASYLNPRMCCTACAVEVGEYADLHFSEMLLLIFRQIQDSYDMHADKCTCCVADRRRGSQDVEVSLEVEVDNQPERYTLSASLSAVLGLKQATRASVLQALWAYIKANRLQVCCLHTCLPAYTPAYLASYLHTCLSTYLRTCLPFYQPIYTPAHLPTYVPTYLCTCQFI